jgi:tetratricopeptide (TPR) repeat protein
VGVRASFALSYQALEPEAARMFRRLGLIPGPHFARGLAAALMESTPDDAERLLETLVDDHLLEVASTAGRYRFHDLVRLYAREQAHAGESDGDREAALLRMFDWYLDTADAAEPLLIPGRRRLPYEPTGRSDKPTFATRGEALAWFEAERMNLLAATDLAASRGFHPRAWQLADASWSFLLLHSYWPDWRDIHRTGLASARTSGSRQAEAWMLCSLGHLDVESLQVGDEVVRLYEQSVALCQDIGDREGEARALSGLGHCQVHMGRLEEAIQCEQRALMISQEIGYAYRQGVALYYLGVAYFGLGRLEEAMKCHQQALLIWRELGDQWNEGVSLNYLSKVFCELRRFEEAIDSAERSLAIAREIGHRLGEAYSLEDLGIALGHTQGVEASRPYWQDALAILIELGTPQADGVRARLAEEPSGTQE